MSLVKEISLALLMRLLTLLGKFCIVSVLRCSGSDWLGFKCKENVKPFVNLEACYNFWKTSMAIIFWWSSFIKLQAVWKIVDIVSCDSRFFYSAFGASFAKYGEKSWWPCIMEHYETIIDDKIFCFSSSFSEKINLHLNFGSIFEQIHVIFPQNAIIAMKYNEEV